MRFKATVTAGIRNAARLKMGVVAAFYLCAITLAGLAPVRATEPESAVVAEPDGYQTDAYRSPVPKTLSGARVIGADEAEKLWTAKAATFVDVYPRAPKPPNLPAGTIWRDPTHMSIDGAHWLPNVGYGVLTPEFESYFKSRLADLAAKEPEKPLVFFCLKNCWMSWNAAKRALSWGYKNIEWFPDGTDGWQEAGLDLVRTEPMP